MKEEQKTDALGRINIVQGNVYLIKDVNYSEHKNIYEWECLSKSNTAYKFLDKINERIFWVENTKFHEKSYGNDGCLKSPEYFTTLNHLKFYVH